jgi:biotin transport system substrate-specific component
MQVAARIDQAKYDVFRWRYELSLPMKLALAFGFAGLTGLIAQLRFGWPVPVTGQTFAVLLAGVLMGRWWGGISMAIYVGLGAAGVPWFAPTAGMSAFTAGGIGHLAGPTGGYLIGFVLASLFLGYFTDRYVRSRSFLSMLGLMLFANFVLIYVPGLLQLHLWLDFVEGSPVSFTALLGIGAVPFVIGDIIKAVTAALIARGVTPKRAYGSEVDGDRWSNWRIP